MKRLFDISSSSFNQCVLTFCLSLIKYNPVNCITNKTPPTSRNTEGTRLSRSASTNRLLNEDKKKYIHCYKVML